ncbi:A/G-specific adenine glycosylase [Hydrogeniiclostridium mannosilyticum]|uniref:Adenine DNA glycosylase n=1 Tax=Hydrogeniiclostridium mannosilyticum TaxID=2764322 RepID=A0A328UB90_9FIRM|nr:A/G-specific adenine glycosylase [Hydrogeniiclostridium mannosilyticum]RAQ28808.1 A/G-specific adenine glycosylase [Hydrogeniiclostridium mannosilyticum]
MKDQPSPVLYDTNGLCLEEIVAPLLAWYRQSARVLPWRENTDPYRVWVSEIMLQQTRVDTVIPYYERFMARLPSVQALAEVREEELLKLWEGLGYYSRARNLQKAARCICKESGGAFPGSYEQLCSLPGVGPYTAGAIASIAFGLPVPAVDGNVLRVLSRLTENPRDIAEPAVKKQMTAALAQVYPAGHCGDFTQSLMELGAVVCVPNGLPKCGSCPLRQLCRAFRHGTQTEYPVQTKKQPRRAEQKTVLLLCCGGRAAVRKRPQGGLLGGLWEFPCLDGALSAAEIAAWLEQQGAHAAHIERALSRKHIFTHVEWDMTAYRVSCPHAFQPDGGGLVWATPEQLADEIALPTAFRRFTRALGLPSPQAPEGQKIP